MLNKEMKISACILAAGKSERMKFPKPFLLFPYEKNVTFLQKIVTEYQNFGCTEINVVFNKFNFDFYKKKNYNFLKNCKIIINEHLSFERFYSVKIGLQNTHNPYIFIHNVDNPFITKKILSQLSKNLFSEGYTTPIFKNKGGHPIILSRKIIDYIVRTKENNLNLRDVLQKFERRNIEINDESILRNINTEEQYQALNLS